MITTRYPDDPKGNKPENAFHEEWIIDSNDNTNRIIRLNHAPFFGTLDITVGDGSYTLVEGKDFEYVFELTALRESIEGTAYMGIQLTNRDINGKFQIHGQHLGGDWYDPLVDILDYLIKVINNPKDGNWFKVTNRPSLYPAKLGYTGYSDLQNKQYIASAIDDISAAAEKKADDQTGLIDDIANDAKALLAEIVAFDYPGHIASLNPHNTTTTQLDAHPLTLEVPDSILAFGMNLRELTNYIRSRGVKEAELVQFLQKWVSASIPGTTFTTAGADTITVRSQASEATLKVDTSKVEVSSLGSVVFSAGYDLAGGRYNEYVCGENTLRVTSGGNKLTGNALTLNGVEILTSRSITRYQQDDAGGEGEELQIAIQSSNINFTGQGTSASPLKGAIDIQIATDGRDGGVKLVGRKGDETAGFAATPAAAKDYDGEFSNYVPKTTQINNKPMSGNGITIGKADFSLDQADNTADSAKPLSTPQKQRTDALVAKVHTHDFSQLLIGSATTSDYGTVVLADTLDKAVLGSGVMPKVLKGLADRLAAVRPLLTGGLPKDALDFTAIGSSSFNIQNNWTLSQSAETTFFLSRTLDASTGKVVGSVDLTKIPNTDWYKRNCAPELAWPVGVKSTKQAFTDMPVYNYGVFLTHAVGATGNGGVPRCSKFRFKSTGGNIKISIGSLTAISQVYLDDVAYALGGNAVDLTPDLAAGVHTVAVVYSNAADAGELGLLFEVMENDSILLASEPGGANFGTVTEFAPYTNTRFFIYANVQTGLYEGHLAPIQSDTVDMNFIYVGSVNTGATAITPNNGQKVLFDKSVDYGMFRELKEHLDDQNAHGFGEGEVLSVVGGLENTKPYNMASKNLMRPMRISGGTITAGQQTSLIIGSNGSGAWVDSRSEDKQQLCLAVELEGNSPYRWENKANPDNDGLDTIDGCVMVRCDESPSIEWWTPPINGKMDTLRIVEWLTDTATARTRVGRAEVKSNAFPQQWAAVGGETVIGSATAEKTWTPNIQYPSYINGVNLARENIYVFRYRYIPKKRELRFTAEYSVGEWGPNLVKGSMFVFKFDTDMSRFFKGQMGFSSSLSNTLRVLGSGFDINTPADVLLKLNRWHGIYNLYLNGSVPLDSASNQNGLVTYFTDKVFWANAQGDVDARVAPLPRWTQSVQLTRDAGLVCQTADFAIPAQMLKGAHYSDQGKKVYAQKNWQPATTYPAVAPGVNYPTYQDMNYILRPAITFKPVSVSIKGIGNMGMEVYVDNVQCFIKSADSTEVTMSGSLVAAPPWMRGCIWVKVKGQPDGVTAYMGCSITLTGANGETLTVDTSDPGWRCVDSGMNVRYQMLVPWHFTQRNWEHIARQLAKEKE